MPSLTPRELTRKRWLEAHPRRPSPPRPPLPHSALPLLGDGTRQPAGDRDRAAVHAWEAHLAAGRIGVAPPAPAPAPAGPPPQGCDYGLASLAAILAAGTRAPSAP